MKMNNENNERMIRDIYKGTQTPEHVKEQIDEALAFLTRQNSLSDTESTVRRRRKPLSFKRILALAAAAILCIGGTVFAAGQLYQMQLNKEKEYQRSLVISSEETLPEKVAEIEMKVNYIPEGFVLNPDKGMEYYYTDPENDDAGYYTGEPALIDTADPMEVPFVADSSHLTINDHDAVYICNMYSADKTWKNEKIYILYEELNRILSVGSWGHADKDELIKMAENITLTSTGNMISTDGLPRWSEIIKSQTIWDEKDSEEVASDDSILTEASEEQMANVHQIGDKFSIRSFLDDENMTELQLEASVTEVQTADDLSSLNEDEIPEEWKDLTGPDGKLISDTLNYIKNGDGEDSMPEIIRTEEQSLKLVCTTVKYYNPGTETIRDAWYMASLIPVVKDGNAYRIFDRTDNTCDCVENEHIGVRHEMSYSDVSGGHNGKNYIPKIAPGESVTVHLAWIVNADELDKLYLDLGGETIFTEDGLNIGYVDLNL